MNINTIKKYLLGKASILSGNYQIIRNSSRKDLERKYENVWKNPNIPKKQLRITELQLGNTGNAPEAIKCLVDQIRSVQKEVNTILEIGCSTGYHSEFFRRAGLKISYSGCDYSPEFIARAKEKYPRLPFNISDARKLNYENNAFDLVISGCCLLHIISYEKAIKEAVRVADKYLIFHRTPVIHMEKTTYTKKIGYGQEMVEIFFNENELIKEFRRNGLLIMEAITHGQFRIKGLDEPVFMKNYLCKKVST